MNLKEIKFETNNDGVVMPKEITVSMTIEEATWIAIVSGRQRGESPHSEIFRVLNGDVFNRYWDDGSADAGKEMGIVTPPIRYDD